MYEFLMCYWILFVFSFFFFFYSIVVLGVCCNICKSSYNISLLSSAPPLFSFILFLKQFQQVSFFCLQHEYMIFSLLSASFTLSFPLPLVPTPRQDCFTFLFYIFIKKHFCLFKIAVQGASLWHFHVYVYYNLNWFMPSIFLLSTLVPFLWWFHQV
jgi:hypothetical protein